MITNNLLASDIFIEKIKEQKEKESEKNIWNESIYEDLRKLQSNNIGKIGESFLQNICDESNIDANIDGTKTKKIGGGTGDGIIKKSSVEIKTAHRGCSGSSFQHELGEKPWLSDYLIFIDVDPGYIYLTILKNFDEDHYKSGNKCTPFFPTKSVTWRKKSGAFKLDTTSKINESNIAKKYTFKVTDQTKISEIGEFINQSIL